MMTMIVFAGGSGDGDDDVNDDGNDDGENTSTVWVRISGRNKFPRDTHCGQGEGNIKRVNSVQVLRFETFLREAYLCKQTSSGHCRRPNDRYKAHCQSCHGSDLWSASFSTGSRLSQDLFWAVYRGWRVQSRTADLLVEETDTIDLCAAIADWLEFTVLSGTRCCRGVSESSFGCGKRERETERQRKRLSLWGSVCRFVFKSVS